MAAIAQAQTAPAGVDAASTQASADIVVSPAPAPSKPVTTSVKEKAAEAATATLSALLPRLAASDTLPLVDRSAMVVLPRSPTNSRMFNAPSVVLETSGIRLLLVVRISEATVNVRLPSVQSRPARCRTLSGHV